MKLFRFMGIWLRSIFTGSFRSVGLPRAEPPRIRLLPEDHDRFIINLLKWVNRNRYLLTLLGTKRKHALQVSITFTMITVNVYRVIPEDKFVRYVKVLAGPEEGLFNFVQREWANGIGADYAPYVQPIREQVDAVQVEVEPIFTFRTLVSKEWLDLLVDGQGDSERMWRHKGFAAANP